MGTDGQCFNFILFSFFVNHKMAVVIICIYSTIVYLLIVKNLQNVQHNFYAELNLN